MKLNKEDLLLYGVTDSKYLKGRKMSELVEEAILGGVTMIQLREKEMTHEAFKQEALDVQSVCQKHHVPLIINDDVELCKEIDADGVHIGQDDLNMVGLFQDAAISILTAARVVFCSFASFATVSSAIRHFASHPNAANVFLLIPDNAIFVSVTIAAPLFISSFSLSSAPSENTSVCA